MLRKAKRFLALTVALIMLISAQTVVLANGGNDDLDGLLNTTQVVNTQVTPFSLTNLEWLIETSELVLVREHYSPASWANYEVALSNAKRVADFGRAAPTQLVDAAYRSLAAAINALVDIRPQQPVPLTPRQAVDIALAAANSLRPNLAQNTPAQIHEAQVAINNARLIVNTLPLTNPNRAAFLGMLNNAERTVDDARVARITVLERQIYFALQDVNNTVPPSLIQTNIDRVQDLIEEANRLIDAIVSDVDAQRGLREQIRDHADDLLARRRAYNVHLSHLALNDVVTAVNTARDHRENPDPAVALRNFERAQEYIATARGVANNIYDQHTRTYYQNAIRYQEERLARYHAFFLQHRANLALAQARGQIDIIIHHADPNPTIQRENIRRAEALLNDARARVAEMPASQARTELENAIRLQQERIDAAWRALGAANVDREFSQYDQLRNTLELTQQNIYRLQDMLDDLLEQINEIEDINLRNAYLREWERRQRELHDLQLELDFGRLLTALWELERRVWWWERDAGYPAGVVLPYFGITRTQIQEARYFLDIADGLNNALNNSHSVRLNLVQPDQITLMRTRLNLLRDRFNFGRITSTTFEAVEAARVYHNVLQVRGGLVNTAELNMLMNLTQAARREINTMPTTNPYRVRFVQVVETIVQNVGTRDWSNVAYLHTPRQV
jgi:hypothetical protein